MLRYLVGKFGLDDWLALVAMVSGLRHDSLTIALTENKGPLFYFYHFNCGPHTPRLRETLRVYPVRHAQ
jgi:hypothetical protein